MTWSSHLKSLALLALLPLFVLIFWLAGVVASGAPNLLVMAVNVHGLTLTSLADSVSQPHAPISLQLLTDARNDAAGVSGSSLVSAASTAAPAPTPSHGAGAPATPSPSPSAAPVPLPIPAPTILPKPTPTPTPTPVLPPPPVRVPGTAPLPKLRVPLPAVLP
jgi:hypothetical protein